MVLQCSISIIIMKTRVQQVLSNIKLYRFLFGYRFFLKEKVSLAKVTEADNEYGSYDFCRGGVQAKAINKQLQENKVKHNANGVYHHKPA